MGFEFDGTAVAVTDTVAKPDFSEFIGSSAPMREVYQTITRLLDNDSTVLILGESGTGKELVANAIHYNSTRFDKPMVIVNCGAIPEDLLESELFGHEKGAFTGAIRDRAGKFELANRGTIFLDEIGEMSPNLQVKLLRVLQDQKFERVGGARVIKVNVRVIAATNKNLEKAVEDGTFREDLFYRLNVVPVELPPLRERGDDVALIIGHFIKIFNKSLKRYIRGISPEALTILKSYRWPGNVRELKHMIERLAILKGEGVIEKADLPAKLRDIEPVKDEQLVKDMLLVGETEELAQLGLDKLMPQSNDEVRPYRAESDEPLPSAEEEPIPAGEENSADIQDLQPILPEEGLNLKEVVEKYETTLIIAALERCGWVKNKAAILLGLNRTTLVEKLKKRKILNGLREDAAA